jgi:hypothetical protein
MKLYRRLKRTYRGLASKLSINMANLVKIGIMYFGKYVQLSISHVLFQHVLRKNLTIIHSFRTTK